MTSLRGHSQTGREAKRRKEMSRKKMIYAILPIVLLLVMTVPFGLADTVTIDVDMDGDAYVNIQNDNGTFSLIYNGRDILAELEHAQKSVNDIEKTLIYWYGLKEAGKLEDHLLIVEEQLNNLTRDLNIILDGLYRNLGFTMHAIGINPGATSVAIQMIAGNATVAEYIDDMLVDLDDILIDLNATDQEFASIQSQIEEIYIAAETQNMVLMETRLDILDLNATLNAEIMNLTERFNKTLEQIWFADMELDNKIGAGLEELRDEYLDEICTLNKELDNQRILSFGGFCVDIFLLLGLFVIFAREKPKIQQSDEINVQQSDESDPRAGGPRGRWTRQATPSS
uniref:Uncharacterized protein n=1 Tax=viral metagenome TaxID=1070528 RepID=A0A6M3LTV1_9ZZZZ